MLRRRLVITGSAVIAAAAVAAGTTAATALVGGPPAKQKPKFAVLLGANEVPDPGDPDGRGSATVIVPSAQKICFAILVTGIPKPTDAHIHRGGPGVAGPVVVPLAPPASGNPGAVAGCVTGPRAVLRDIARRPGRYYVNVHTGNYPGGALRGQLFAR